MFNLVGDLLLLSWQALLRVQSEAIPLQIGTHDSVHCLPRNRHSAVFVASDGTLYSRLRTGKHRPQGSLLVGHVCAPPSNAIVCALGTDWRRGVPTCPMAISFSSLQVLQL